eukprot:TRINITY_DN11762_c0_g1_i1.p1 TRINITY_DN11762_c0_g1~~TRINITY_DN11762_c0_g1_i1.p1  ORF type:complete len:311 (+),score=60.23 TRINITY_DN11762_c0_g1_i1:169-1101(+)
MYIPMECINSEKNMGKEQMDAQGGVDVNGTATTVCKNDNRYTFHMKPIEETTLYLVLGDDVSVIGHASVGPHVFLPHEDTPMDANVTMHFNNTQLRNMLDYDRLHGEPMMMSASHVWGSVEVDLFGLKLRSPWQEKTNWCGWLIDPKERLNGPLVCGESLDALRRLVKPANSTATPFAVYVPREKIREGAQFRSLVCGVVMGVSLFVLMVSILCSMSQWRAHSRRTSKPSADDAATLAEEGRLQSPGEAAHGTLNTTSCDSEARETRAAGSSLPVSPLPTLLSTPTARDDCAGVAKTKDEDAYTPQIVSI